MEIVCRFTGSTRLISHDQTVYQLVTGTGGIVHYDTTPSINYRQHDDNKLGTKFSFKERLIVSLNFWISHQERD